MGRMTGLRHVGVWAVGSLALIVASFAVGQVAGAAGETVVVNEIHYNPADSDPGGGDAEFIELHNPGTNALDVALMIQS